MMHIFSQYISSTSTCFGRIQPHHQEVCMQKIGTYSFQMSVCCPVCHLKIISTNCYVHTVVPPDDGPIYARNMYRVTKYTNYKLCAKLVFFTRLYRDAWSTKHKENIYAFVKQFNARTVQIVSFCPCLFDLNTRDM